MTVREVLAWGCTRVDPILFQPFLPGSVALMALCHLMHAGQAVLHRPYRAPLPDALRGRVDQDQHQVIAPGGQKGP